MDVKNSQLISKYVKTSQGTEILIYLVLGLVLILPMNCDGSLKQNGRTVLQGSARGRVKPLPRAKPPSFCCVRKQHQVHLVFGIRLFGSCVAIVRYWALAGSTGASAGKPHLLASLRTGD